MCGIAGVYSLYGGPLPPFDARRVLRTLEHRGPDDEGVFLDGRVWLGVRRLAIIDPEMGHQPVADEQGRFHLVMNGEVFDYDILLAQLQQRGHRFRSRCDTEVVVHLVEELWSECVERIDGQYSIAAYDARDQRFFLARDRMGICPLFYAQVGEYLVFASEMKAIFATGLVQPAISRRALDAVLAFGCMPAPGAIFEGIHTLMPGEVLAVRGGSISKRTYWDIPYNDAGQYPHRRVEDWCGEFRQLLAEACIRRLKADVPVGLFLSGGIDSATIAAMTADYHPHRHEAFSIAFPEPGFDERRRTRRIVEFLGTPTRFLTYRQRDLASDMPRMVYHAETPLLITESVPLMALAGLAHRHVKVVLTGEGADEALGGYVYFRWEALKAAVGEGWGSRLFLGLAGPLLRRLLGPRNPFVPQPADYGWALDVFGCYPAIMMQFLYFRAIREIVYSPEMLARQRGLGDAEFLDLPRERMKRWDQYNRTLYISSRVFMTNHLLGAHSDRALMAHSVEGRYPFLDRTVQEFLGQVPPVLKGSWHTDKLLLRRAMARRLPQATLRTRKKAFLTPFGTQFVGEDATEYIRHLLSPRMLSAFGYFDPAKVRHVVQDVAGDKAAVARDPRDTMRPKRELVRRVLAGMALTFVVSTQILEDQVRQGNFSGQASGPTATVP
jgi:asparagine synthase (glutamine-hydrolysing)